MATVNSYMGSLLGMGIGDALGYRIDDLSWEEICDNYGPNGLLGYDLQEEYAPVTSYTQIAAYLCNGLLLSISRGSRDSRMPYLTLGLREWARSQLFYRDPERSFCWIAKLPAFRRRNCRDARMLANLRLQSQGSLDAAPASPDSPGPVTAGVAMGLFYDSKRLEPCQIGELTYNTIALTHGKYEAALCGVVLAYIIAGIQQEPDVPLMQQFRGAIAAMQGQFPGSEADQVADFLKKAIDLRGDNTLSTRQGMETLGCRTAAECLGGAMYACLTLGNDFDAAIIGSINHSGHSAATGAITGAILGGVMGAANLPEFYLESLEPAQSLTILAQDLLSATPASGIFDDDWDRKYVHGEPLDSP